MLSSSSQRFSVSDKRSKSNSNEAYKRLPSSHKDSNCIDILKSVWDYIKCPSNISIIPNLPLFIGSTKRYSLRSQCREKTLTFFSDFLTLWSYVGTLGHKQNKYWPGQGQCDMKLGLYLQSLQLTRKIYLA